MGTLFLSAIKRQASSFLQEKYRNAKLAFTDVTQAELLTDEATNNDPLAPDAKTMTRIAEASFDIDDYWRIADVLHRKLYSIDWKLWRQSYRSLVLLEFLLTHGPEDFAEEFKCDTDVIRELGKFKHIDESGFNWGVNMQKKSEGILSLLSGGEILEEARLKALKITKEIQGFGNLLVSPSSGTSRTSSFGSSSFGSSSFGSYSTNNSIWNETEEFKKHGQPSPTKEHIENYWKGGLLEEKPSTFPAIKENVEGSHLWDCPPIQENGSLLDPEKEEDCEEEEEKGGLIGGICSKLGINSPLRCDDKKVAFRSLSDVGKVMKKKMDRQFSIGP
ncbi:hypothetical protein HHK36_022514 [Tetracentron sinense]|uniref:ENTH domain-containing protein n=1 Tax=Tetracentron sinense TaxID=13715 RepID=A0A834YPQ8_TETSI|nr:hypothetical protein HHK36_022514 [Tetracentron sinense]